MRPVNNIVNGSICQWQYLSMAVSVNGSIWQRTIILQVTSLFPYFVVVKNKQTHEPTIVSRTAVSLQQTLTLSAIQ